MKNNPIVIGDIHGHHEELLQILNEHVYPVENQQVILLGDLVDRGPDSGQTVKVVLELQQRGRLEALIVGNHEHKLYRKIIGRDVKLGLDAQRSFAELTSHGMLDTFKQLVDGSYLVYGYKTMDGFRDGCDMFVHGALPKPYLRALTYQDVQTIEVKYVEYLAMSKKESGYLEPAFYGYTDGMKQPDGFPTRLLAWLDQVPDGVTVYKGHDAMYSEVHTRESAAGGKVVFMDTGSGKAGGKLSWRYT